MWSCMATSLKTVRRVSAGAYATYPSAPPTMPTRASPSAGDRRASSGARRRRRSGASCGESARTGWTGSNTNEACSSPFPSMRQRRGRAGARRAGCRSGYIERSRAGREYQDAGWRRCATVPGSADESGNRPVVKQNTDCKRLRVREAEPANKQPRRIRGHRRRYFCRCMVVPQVFSQPPGEQAGMNSISIRLRWLGRMSESLRQIFVSMLIRSREIPRF